MYEISRRLENDEKNESIAPIFYGDKPSFSKRIRKYKNLLLWDTVLTE